MAVVVVVEVGRVGGNNAADEQPAVFEQGAYRAGKPVSTAR